MGTKERPTAYRCGWCGQPTDKDGYAILGPEEGADYDNAEPTNGRCCPNGDGPRGYVSREMAMSAGDLSLEGMPVW